MTSKTDKNGRDLANDEVFTVRMGLLNVWVCAPKHLTRDEVQAQVDLLPPAGTTFGWQVEEKEDDDPELRSPGLCAEDDNRQHWNCVC